MAQKKDRDKKRATRVKQMQRRQARQESPQAIAERAARGEWVGSHITSAWRDPDQLTQLAIARRLGEDERVAYASLLLDLACLGVKDGFLRIGTGGDYRALVEKMADYDSLEPCEPALAAKVAHAARAYAEGLGFAPGPDAVPVLAMFADVDPADCAQDVPVGGPDGKPNYVAGPDDNATRIIKHLRRRFGEDGFHYVATFAMP